MKVFERQKYLPIFAILFLAFFLVTASHRASFSGVQTATFAGRIISLKLGPWVPFANRTATLVIEDSKGRHHTVHAGVKTSYYPHRTPQYGDRVIVNCIRDKGLWAATTVTYK